MRQFEVTSGGAQLAAEESGDGPLVVALHAGVADRRSWRSMAAAMAGYRFVAYDRRGFGETAYEPETFSHMEDLTAVMSAASTGGAAVLVGNSMGGALALEYTLAHPEQVAALVLIAPAVDGAPDEFWAPTPGEVALEEQVGAAAKAGDLELLNRLEVHFWLDGPEAPDGRVAGEVRDLALDMNAIALRAKPTGDEQQAAGEPAWERLGGLTAPTLLIAGDLDESSMPAVWRGLVERAPHAEFVLIPGVAHLPQMERPQEVADLVRDFLGRNGVARR
ncbi:MAG: alpha/beta hydrolase [Dehalococcoidia bacterium]